LSATDLKRDVLSYAKSLGFERAGVASVDPLNKDEAFLKHWLAQGCAGEMDYLKRASEKRARPAELLPGAKSVIALAMNYYVSDVIASAPIHKPSLRGRSPEVLATDEAISPFETSRSPCRSLFATALAPRDDSISTPRNDRVRELRIARYAHGPDYHKVIAKRLDSLVRYMKSLEPKVKCKTFVDTGPLLERAVAQRAGLGFIGKNTMLITRGLGSWVFLANIVTTLDLPVDAPDERNCGKCRLCIEACPTKAITAPYTLDPRRCIAYLTIESRQPIPEDLRPPMGGWMFGCDVCQEVCPHNVRKRFPSPQPSPRGRGSKGEGWLVLSKILDIQGEVEFRQLFTGTAFMRAGREGLLRNACVAAANLNREDLIPRLQKIARNDSKPIVREHAAWALDWLRAGRVSRVL
jgi:epoxyqueuosine reductase